MNKPNFFIIPGFRMQTTDKPFAWLVDFLLSKGFNVIKVPVEWNYKVLSQNAEDFVDFYLKNKGEKNYILGFSYGAVLAFLTANQLNPNKIFLCSLSPTFREDRDWNKKIINYIGKRRFEDSLKIGARDIAKNLKISSVIFCGEKEADQYPALLKRCKEVAKLSPKSKLVLVEKAPHQIDFPTYVDAIKKELK